AGEVAEPLADFGCQGRTAIQRNEPDIMDHLVDDGDVAGSLNDVDVVVVEAGKNRGRQPPCDTSLERRAILWTVSAPAFASTRLAPESATSGGALLCLCAQRWQPSVRGIHNQRGP